MTKARAQMTLQVAKPADARNEDIQSTRLNGNGVNGGFYDPAFSNNKTSPIHRWTPWIAGYSFRFVDNVITAHLRDEEDARILDPFCGVGTTQIQARAHGYDSIGFEINPFAALATRVKLAAFDSLSPIQLKETVPLFCKLLHSNKKPITKRPEGFKSRIPFFSPPVEHKVLKTIDFIESIEDPNISDAFRLALGSIIVSVSNYTYEPSLGSRPAAGKPLIENADVADIVSRKIYQMVEDAIWVQKSDITGAESTIHNGDFLEYTKYERRKCRLAITSPPYLNNYHYVRNTRPQLWWLGLVEGRENFRDLEERNIGKYWQTVRGMETLDLTFYHNELEDILRKMKNTRKDKGQYGGLGWANYVTSYFNDCSDFLDVLFKATNKDGEAVIVVGNSIVQGFHIPVETYLADIAEMHGWNLTRIDTLREKRIGASILNSSVRRGKKPGKSKGLYESAVILSK